jgi:hypothetical protein
MGPDVGRSDGKDAGRPVREAADPSESCEPVHDVVSR